MYLPKPIKDLGNATLTKVANKFVDFVITKYTGKSIKAFEAEGDIEADKVKTKWEILEKPFWLQAEAVKMNRQYTNMGNVLTMASAAITAPENKITDDNDVFWGLLEHSKEISNEEMQALLAKIIAGEYNAPNTYSMGTLQAIKIIGKNELELFQQAISLSIDKDYILLPEKSIHALDKYGLNYDSILELEEARLIHIGMKTIELSGGIVKMNTKSFKIKSPGTRIDILALTKAGRELGAVIDIKTNNRYFVDIQKILQGKGVEIL